MDANTAEDNPQVQSLERSDQNGSQDLNLQKIYRQGDKIYQAPNENITMINKNFPKVINEMSEIPRADAEESFEIDKIESGESLVKTFTFDQKISEEETEKCITFWRSVVEKHLEPIKCTLIENTKSKADAATQKKSTANGKPRKKSTSIVKDSLESQVSKSYEKGKNKWNEIILELQKKKIAETKLRLERKCRFCGYFNSPPYESQDPDQQNKEMITELDDWKPKSYSKFSKKGSRCEQYSVSSKRKSTTSEPTTIGESPGLETVPETNEEIRKCQEVSEKQKLEQIRLASLNIQHVDLIAEKKKSGAYSQWRKNNLAPCECNQVNCDCNTNPAIENITLDSASKQNRKSSVSKAASKQQEVVIQCIPEKIPEIEAHPSPIEVCVESSDPDFSTQETKKESMDLSSSIKQESRREVTISVDGKLLITSQEMQADDDDDDIPLKVSEPQTETSDNELNRGISQTNSPTRSMLSDLHKRSILISEGDKQRKRSNYSGRSARSLSVMIQCTCSYENCDCRGAIKESDPPPNWFPPLMHSHHDSSHKGSFHHNKHQFKNEIYAMSICVRMSYYCQKLISQLPEKSILSDEEIDIPKPPKSQASLRRVNSLEIIKRRLSSATAVSDTQASPKFGASKSELSRRGSEAKSVDSLEIVRRKLSKISPDKKEDDEQDEEEVGSSRSRTVSISFNV
ncbi:unnamed protein product [Ceutorhynchus assimilis]|uniref:Uncharacterized protein n=1 Tax=Ceutorhynchus assimilis TaxID=467358 RepID=A0A9N9MR48_9CUCU|nr:unnamed protein product [Ceutorhynchus assimilis]